MTEVTIAHECAAYLLGYDHVSEGGCDNCDDTAGLDRETWFAHEVWRFCVAGMGDL